MIAAIEDACEIGTEDLIFGVHIDILDACEIGLVRNGQ